MGPLWPLRFKRIFTTEGTEFTEKSFKNRGKIFNPPLFFSFPFALPLWPLCPLWCKRTSTTEGTEFTEKSLKNRGNNFQPPLFFSFSFALPLWPLCPRWCKRTSTTAATGEPQSLDQFSTAIDTACPCSFRNAWRWAAFRSLATISAHISCTVISGTQPSFSLALVGSPSRVSTSAGRK